MGLELLLERVKAASGPDRELDLALGALWSDPPFNLSVNQQRGGKPPVFKFTASIDAALALVERVLPGWFWRAGHVPNQKWDGREYRDNWAHLSRTDASNCDRGDEATGWAATPALAILAALLTALIAQKETT